MANGFDARAARDQLRGDDAEARRRALRSIPDDAGDSGLELLVVGLGDDSWRVRKEAVDRLAQWPRPTAAASRLVRIIEETDEVGLRNSAIETLHRIGTPAAAALTRSLAARPRHRKFLIDALGALGDPRGAIAIVRGLEDSDPNVRMAAAEALGRVGGSIAVRALVDLARTGDMMLQLTALDGLSRLGAVVPVDVLAPCVNTPVVRASALRLLGYSRDAAAIPTLVDALAHKTRRAREAAILALARLADDLTDDAADGGKLQSAIAEVEPDVVEQVTRALTAREPEVRTSAARLLGLGRHRSGIPQLTAGLLDAHSGVACAAAIELMGPEAVAPLEKLAREADEVLREEIRTLEPAREARAEMSAEEFRALRDLIYEHCGIWFEDDAAYLVRRRLAPRLAAVGVDSFDAYYRLLRFGRDGRRELDEVVVRITTNETYFFREAYQLRAFRDEILQELIDEQPRGRHLTVWSAGCSTGEEPYTVAMLIRDRPELGAWDVEVVGSDISTRVLEIGRLGRYGPSSVRTRDLPELRRFVAATAKGYQVVDPIRDLVRFERINLLDEAQIAAALPGGTVDVILCRNVLMYFDRQARQRVVASFFERLAPGGYLLLGHSESLLNLSNEFELAHLRNDTVYRKPLR